MSSITLEICTGSLQSIRAAAAAGAQRVELCAALEVGGLTPSLGYLKTALAIPGIRKNVLIRPRAGHFCYNAEEIALMLHDIRLCHELGADGVVVGALTETGDLDVRACQQFRDEAGTMSLTFHRAFDVCREPLRVLDQLIELGYDRILTSGQAPRAEQAIPLLRQLVEHAQGRISIMPGSGVSPANAAHILRETGAIEIHASAKGNLACDSELFPGFLETSESIVADILHEIAQI